MSLRVLVVRALTPWTTFVDDLRTSAQAEGRLLTIYQCHPNVYQVQAAMERYDPQVVLWCRVPSTLVRFLKGWHQGRTFVLFNWDSPTLFRQRTHMEEALTAMDASFTTDQLLPSMTYLLPPVKLAPLEPETPNAYPTHDVFIGVTTLYTDATDDIAIDRHQLFRVLDKSSLAFGLYGPDDPLASRYPRSYRGYLPPQDFAKVAAKATLCLSLHPHSAPGYLNERTCRILACGRPLVVDASEGPTNLLKDMAFFLDAKATPQDWLASISQWVSPSHAETRRVYGEKGRTWIGKRATWSHWWSAFEPSLTPKHTQSLVVKPYCGLCNQLISIFQAISLAKQSGRRLWIQGFQPAFNVYPDYGRKPIEDVFVMDALSRVFEWPISGVPDWADTSTWPSPQRASQAKLFKRPKSILRSDTPVVYGGFLFFPNFPCLAIRKTFLASLEHCVTPRVRETCAWVMDSLGLTARTYNVLHLRLEEDMVAHLAKRSGTKMGQVRHVLMGVYDEIIAKLMVSETGVSETEVNETKTFICIGTELHSHTQAYLATTMAKLNGLTSNDKQTSIAIRLGKGRELAALIDFMIASKGARFAGTSVSSFSEIIGDAYDEGSRVLFPHQELWARLDALKRNPPPCASPRPLVPDDHPPAPGERSGGLSEEPPLPLHASPTPKSAPDGGDPPPHKTP